MSTNTNSNVGSSGNSNVGSQSQSQSNPSTARADQAPPSTAPPPLPVPEVYERPKLSSKSNDEELLKEVCLNNGITFSKLGIEGPELEVLEMFFSGFPRLIGLHHFPNIHTMTIIGQSIPSLSGLSTLNRLKELWVAECQIQKIENLDKCIMLEKLYLYGNQITHIDNLHLLTDLKVLWLNSNLIKNIENLTNLVKLKELNLAENKIEKIGHALNQNIHIEELNLSGNPISSLRDLTNLVRLPRLYSLSMKDPLYMPCPVSQQCNYSTHILFHLPSLRRLDTYDVTAKHLSELAHSTVLKKKMYYNMRVKTLHRNMSNLLQRLDQHKSTQLMALPHQRLRTITYAMKEIEREMHERKQEHVEDSAVHDSDTESERDAREQTKGSGDTSRLHALNGKLEALKNRKYHWESTCADMEEYCEEAKARIQHAADGMVNRLVVELETGGNVRFEEGASTDVWFTSCHDLVMSRFCATDFKANNVVGIKIHRIIRIHNRILRVRFDKRLTHITEGPLGEYYPGTKNTAYKKLLEYLFWIWDPETPGGTMEPARVPEEGFQDAETHKMLGRDAAVPLSNSLSLADRHRISYLRKQRAEHTAADPCPFRFGQLIIAKTYLGKSASVIDNKPIATSSYPKIDAVFKPRKKCVADNDASSACECNARQCEWYIFDHELVLPEYIVDFEYVTKEPSWSPYTQVTDDLSDNKVVDMPAPPLDTHGAHSDDVALNMPPEIPQRPRMVTLTEELLLKSAKSETLSTITYLNLHGNGLTKLKHIQSLLSLKKLVVSFNELTRLDELTHMNIEYIDASFNKIVTLEGMKSMSRLEHLDLTWNQLHNTREELSVLRKHCSALRHLDIRHNPWLKPDGLKLRVVGRIKTLKWLNGEIVTEQEGQMALRMAAGSRISQLSLLTNSRTDSMLPRSLSLGCGAHIIAHNSRLKPDKVSEADTSWYSKVTTVNLESQHMTKMSNLERLENLRWASFNDNDLTKIEGLDSCIKLEDLSLDSNCIARLDGLSKLTRLRRLSLAHNQLTSLDTGALTYLPHLVYLALDNNRLTSLAGLHQAQALVELYIGNNLITNIREIFLLKQLPNLVILDMYGNPVTMESDNYRLFVIYHLKTLKALDGNAVEAQEGNMAKDMFGGRLTPDFVAEKLGHATFQDVRELDLPACNIRIVDLGGGDQFINLRRSLPGTTLLLPWDL